MDEQYLSDKISDTMHEIIKNSKDVTNSRKTPAYVDFVDTLKTTIRYLIENTTPNENCEKFNEIKVIVQSNKWGYLKDINWNDEDTSEIDAIIDSVLGKYSVIYK